MRARSRSGDPRGFTLIELMIVVAIIAILALVVIPSFFRDSAKKQYDTEVNAVFAELAIKEEQYKIENGTYLATAPCPAAPVAGIGGTAIDLNANCIANGQAWCPSSATGQCLRMTPGVTSARCSYQVFAGAPAAWAAPAGFTMTAPVGQWYYAIATCDIDGKGGTNTEYFTAFSNQVTANGHGYQTLNYGQ